MSLMCVRTHLTLLIDLFSVSPFVHILVCACVCVKLGLFIVGLNLSMKFFLLFGVMSYHQSGILALF